jgi:hypothetical protein
VSDIDFEEFSKTSLSSGCFTLKKDSRFFGNHFPFISAGVTIRLLGSMQETRINPDVLSNNKIIKAIIKIFDLKIFRLLLI